MDVRPRIKTTYAVMIAGVINGLLLEHNLRLHWLIYTRGLWSLHWAWSPLRAALDESSGIAGPEQCMVVTVF